MYIGYAILIAVSVIIYLGFAQRALDRLHLSDRGALAFLLAIIVGGFLPDIPLGGDLGINIGGGLVPVIICGYLWATAERGEIIRSIVAVVVAGTAVYLLMKIYPAEPTYGVLLDPLYIAALVAGVMGYLTGRSRRGAFIAGTLAIIINDLGAQVENYLAGVSPTGVIGGAGVIDAVVIAGILALGLAEVLGESLERVVRSTEQP